ncbi:MAG: PilW family protein [Desulfuromusa sp.]|nr:PilW family protein [Desulfuromusa sp.]
MHFEKTKYNSSNFGFTLVEMLVALVITSVIGISIMTLYINSSRTYDAQTQVAEAQQNVRAAIESIVFDLRNAGYNPTGAAITGLGFVQAGTNVLQITMDLSDDTGIIDPRVPDGNLTKASGGSDPNENVTYSLYTAAGISRLGRNTGAGNDPVAEYIQAVGFAYAFDSDGDGALDFDDNGTPADTSDDRILWSIQDPAGGGNWFEVDANGDNQITAADDTDSDGTINAVDTGIAVDLADIRAVKIWVLGTARRADRDYTSTQSYVVGNRVIPPNNNFRRRLLSTVVTCRNMGL